MGNTLLSQSFESNGNGCYTNPTPGFINSDCITLSADVIKSVPAKYALNQNYPNPFNPITRITYSISNNEYIDIYITDLNGSNIKYLFKGNVLSGSHSIIWDGTNDSSNDMPSGVYFLTLKSSTFNQTIKMMYLK